MIPVGDLPLVNRRVLITRPASQSSTLCKLVSNAGGEAILLPAIEIQPQPVSEREIKLLSELDEGDVLIFTSRNAVRFLDHVIADPACLFRNLRIFAVGTGTSRALNELGITRVISPDEGGGSEALLKLDQLQKQSVQGVKIVIMRGAGGRELLRDTLRSRGANIDVVELYRRLKPVLDPGTVKNIWRYKPPHIIVITSGEGLQNLVNITPKEERIHLFGTPLVVISDRIRDLAISSGFTHSARVAGNTGDEALLDAMIEILEERQE